MSEFNPVAEALMAINAKLDDINKNLGWLAGMERCMHEQDNNNNPNCWHCQNPLRPFSYKAEKTIDTRIPLASLNQDPNRTRTFTAIAKGKPKMSVTDYLNKSRKVK